MSMFDPNVLEHILLSLEQLLAQGVSPPAAAKDATQPSQSFQSIQEREQHQQ